MDYINSPEDVPKAINKLSSSNIATYGLDIETNGLDFHKNDILLIQVGNKEYQAVFDVYRCKAEIFTLLDWLAQEDTTKILHNAVFDLSFIKAEYGYDIPNIKCTYLAEQLLTSGKNVKRSLDSVLKKYLNVTMSKDEQTTFVDKKLGSDFTDEQLEYAGEDVRYLPALIQQQEQLIRQRNINDNTKVDFLTLAKIEYQTVYSTVDMQVNGIYVHPQKWKSLKDKAAKQLRQAEAELDEMFAQIQIGDNLFGNPDINYASHEQLKPALEQILDRNLPDTSEDTLSQINHPVIDKILRFRKYHTRVTRYGEEFLNKNVSKVTGRVHTDFKQIGAATGRYASRNPNAQNIPNDKEYRAAFCVQDPNYKMIAADFSNQEIRLLAYLSEDPTFLEAIKKGDDLHCIAASMLFDVPYENFFDEEGEMIPEMKKEYRKPAKALNFGLIYGMGPSRLARQLDISYDEANRLMRRYFNKFPNIKDTLDEFVDNVMNTHIAISPLDNRRVNLSSIDWDNPGHVAHAKNQAKNLPMQGGGATVMKLALCMIRKQIKKKSYDADLLVTVHDELVLRAHEDEVDEVAQLVEDNMIKAFNKLAPGVKMEVDALIADHWKH